MDQEETVKGKAQRNDKTWKIQYNTIQQKCPESQMGIGLGIQKKTHLCCNNTYNISTRLLAKNRKVQIVFYLLHLNILMLNIIFKH